ncbi:uncharacterized protein [Lolium perenne]|uniref:uncharacterized protein isoform X1 n=1 Tax=Lolium perenne TaxID=4522 RepID=UPI003A9A23B8
MEPYFREMSLDDFEALLPSVSNRLDPCFIIPFVGSGKEQRVDLDPSDVAVVAESSNPTLVSGKENEEPENHSAHANHAPQHESSDFVLRSSVKLARSNGDSEEHCEQEVILQQEAVTQLDPGKSLADDSLNWLLASRGRFVLTSERPNKKRKLLGADAGLERLVWLPPMPGEAATTCDVCCLGDTDVASNRMLHCSSCKVSVHQRCYGVQVVPDGYWTCAWCDGISSAPARMLSLNDGGRIVSMPCVLCPREKGALKPVKCDPGQAADGGNLSFAHLFCSLWAPEVLVEDMDSMEPVTNIGDIPENRTKMVCTLCKVMHGACVRCSHGTCRACFHPICARESKHQMEIWGKSGLKNVELRIFCSRHSRVRSISSVHNANGVTEQDTARVGLDDEIFTTDKKQQMRFTRKSKDKFMNGISISSSSSSLNKVQTAELVTTPCTARAIETQQIEQTHMVVDQPTGDGNLVSSSTDVSAVLRKLIDQGKVSVGDIESELGLSSESLEAALVPETTTFSPGLKLKIIKLLQNSVHVSSVQVKPLEESDIAPEGTLLRSESKNLTDSQPGSELEEGISSFDHNYPDSDKADKDWSNSVENSSHTGRDCEDDHISGQRVLNVDGYRCYIHPYVEKKLQDLWGHISNQNKQSCYHVEELSCVPHDQNLADLSTKLEQLTEIAAADEASKAESSDILEHSPRDEIEGEIIYFQSRLLNDVVSKNQRYEDLKFKVVQSLSHELDSFNKRKWDHIIVNQFLRDIREAKKRGNSERRHKEAQAILAAAAPCAAPSLRNETFKKETENDAAPVKQESITKINAGSLRVSQLTLLPQTKDLSFSSSKVSADSNFGIFDLAKFSKKNDLPCDVCMRRETVLNRIFLCSSCKQAAVHLDCYQSRMNPTGPWKCERCQEMLSDTVISANASDCSGAISWLVHCGLCHGTLGAFRKTTKGQWVHAFCAEWLLENTFRRGQHNAVDVMEENLLKGDTCSICHHNVGTCLKCCTVGCQVTFHPACARDAGLYMNTKKIGNLWRHKAYCGNHSTEQRKVDSQQYGPEEVKIMKQMRVELERLRLLCERIVKREKEKKELVVCEHDILAIRRDYVASSIQTPFYMSGTGASSESATTSVNNNSYSGKRQRSDEVTVRSDDVTVDSTISRKNTVRFPIHSKDTDRNTADSSTSTISYKQKLDDGELLADKNLQERAVVASQKSGDEETKNSSTSTISYKRKLDDGEIIADKNLQERAVIASQKSVDGETKNSSTSTISYKRKLDDGELLADKNLQGGEVTPSQKSVDGETKNSLTSTISYKRKLDDGELLADKNLQGGEVIASQKSGDGETKSIDKKYGETVQNELVATCDQARSLKPCDQAMSLKPCDQAMPQKQVPPKRYVYTRKKKQRIQDVVQVPGNA